MFDRVYGGIDPIVTTILTLMGLYGGASEHPDIDVTDYVTPAAHRVAESVIETGCLDEITEALIPVAVAGPFTADPRTTEPARSIILRNDVGNVAVKKAPLFLASGTTDSWNQRLRRRARLQARAGIDHKAIAVAACRLANRGADTRVSAH
jgi:hypothetical protein